MGEAWFEMARAVLDLLALIGLMIVWTRWGLPR
jgi:hypothetical protein